MKPHEEQLLDFLPRWVDGDERLPAPLAIALEKDADLRARWQRWQQQLKALRGLERQLAPRDLAGRIVAATHGGHRQVRALDHLTALQPETAPAELEQRVRRDQEQPFPLRAAPPELDSRVERELQDLPAAAARRFTGRLHRHQAPEELSRRLLSRRLAGNPGGRRRAGLVTAMTVMAVLVVGGWLRFRSSDAGSSSLVPTELTFEIERIDPRDADDQGHAIVAAFSGFAGGVIEGSRR